jgi:hypothetical protein
MRFMMFVKHGESEGVPPKSLMDAMTKLVEDETKAGRLIDTGGFLPTSKGASVRLRGGKITVTDGPYAEGREVIGGYAQFELESTDVAIKAAVDFMELHKTHWPGWNGETEVRQIMGPEDFPH